MTGNTYDTDADDKTIVEVYENSHLFCNLKFKNHFPGASKRQIKRINY